MPFILSDTHVRSNNELKFLVNLVDQLRQEDDVILLGDILDFTKVPFVDLEYTIDMFDKPGVYYIYGNHDIVAPQLGFKCQKELKYDGILFTHGHEFEALLRSTGFTTPEEYNSLFERLCYNRNTMGIGARLSWTLWNALTKFKRVHGQKFYNEMFNYISKLGNVVIGHCHYEMYSKTRRVLICDDAQVHSIVNSKNTSRTDRKNKPIGYYLDTQTFNMERFEIDSVRKTLRFALNAKRDCLSRGKS